MDASIPLSVAASGSPDNGKPGNAGRSRGDSSKVISHAPERFQAHEPEHSWNAAMLAASEVACGMAQTSALKVPVPVEGGFGDYGRRLVFCSAARFNDSRAGRRFVGTGEVCLPSGAQKMARGE
jgi:hypothetical protein